MTPDLNRVAYGSVNVSYTRHQGKTTKVSTTYNDHHKFETHLEGLQHIDEVLNWAEVAKQNGYVSFTLVLKNGKIKEIIEQTHQTEPYEQRHP